FLQPLCKIMNKICFSGSIPSILKISKIVPIPKVKNPVSANDLRPIAVQPVLTKLLGKFLFNQLTEYFNAHNMLSNVQFGCRKFHSTTFALITIYDFIIKEISENKFCIFVALDIRKAYDRACREILIHKLKWYGIDCNVINSFLSERTQYVCMCKNNVNINS